MTQFRCPNCGGVDVKRRYGIVWAVVILGLLTFVVFLLLKNFFTGLLILLVFLFIALVVSRAAADEFKCKTCGHQWETHLQDSPDSNL